MAQDIVSGLFGLTPAQVQQQQQQQLALQAQRYAQQDPFQRATAGMYHAGAGLAQAGAEGLFGMQNPEVVAAQQRQAMDQQMDLTTPQGTYAAAKMAQDRGDVEMAAKLAAMARQMEEEQSVQQFRAAQTQQMMTPKTEKVDMTNIEKLYAARDRALAAGNQQMANSIEAVIRKETKSAGVGSSGSVSKKEADKVAKQKEQSPVVEDALRTTLDAAQSLIDHPGRKTATGKSAIFNPIQYGTDAADFIAELESFKAKTFVPMVSQLKGMGALSDAEGKKLTAAVGALDEKMTEEGFKASLQKILNELNLAYKTKTGKAWSPTTTTAMQESAGVITAATKEPDSVNKGAVSLDEYLKSQGY